MNKLIVLFFFIAIFILSFFSCDDKKNEKEESYPYIYQQNKVEYLPVALYSNTGVSYDQTKIKAFRNRLLTQFENEYNNNNDSDLISIKPRPNLGNFVFDDMIEYCNNEIIAQQISKDSIQIIRPESIFPGWINYMGIIEYDMSVLNTEKQKNGITYWESDDTTYIYRTYYNNGLIFILSFYDSGSFILYSKFDSLTPLYYVKSQMPDIMGTNFFSEYKYCTYLVENKDSIYIPYMEILYISQGNTVTYKLNNIPLSDKQIIPNIAEGDTLILQQSRLYLSKYSKTN